MNAYGQYLLKGPTSTGILTADDSDRVIGFYNYFAEYEAIATLMKGQWDSIRFEANPDEFARFVDTQINGYQKQEHAALPPRIPPDAILALPAEPTARTSTRHVQMWMTNLKVRQDLTWDPSTPGARGSVDEAINTLNTTDAGEGYKDWKVPSRSELDSLFAGRYNPASPADANKFLGRIAPSGVQWRGLLDALTGVQAHPYLWTADPAGVPSTSTSPAVKCVNHISQIAKFLGPITGYAHTALGPTSASLNGYPSGYTLTNVPGVHVLALDVTAQTDDAALSACRAMLAAQVTQGFAGGARAQLLATRNTGDVDYLP
jgi:hypothetical protein